MENDKRIAELEIRLSFLEDTLEQLNAVISRQDQEIRQLTKLLTQFDSRVQSITEQLSPEITNEPPPHY